MYTNIWGLLQESLLKDNSQLNKNWRLPLHSLESKTAANTHLAEKYTVASVHVASLRVHISIHTSWGVHTAAAAGADSEAACRQTTRHHTTLHSTTTATTVRITRAGYTYTQQHI